MIKILLKTIQESKIWTIHIQDIEEGLKLCEIGIFILPPRILVGYARNRSLSSNRMGKCLYGKSAKKLWRNSKTINGFFEIEDFKDRLKRKFGKGGCITNAIPKKFVDLLDYRKVYNAYIIACNNFNSSKLSLEKLKLYEFLPHDLPSIRRIKHFQPEVDLGVSDVFNCDDLGDFSPHFNQSSLVEMTPTSGKPFQFQIDKKTGFKQRNESETILESKDIPVLSGQSYHIKEDSPDENNSPFNLIVEDSFDENIKVLRDYRKHVTNETLQTDNDNLKKNKKKELDLAYMVSIGYKDKNGQYTAKAAEYYVQRYVSGNVRSVGAGNASDSTLLFSEMFLDHKLDVMSNTTVLRSVLTKSIAIEDDFIKNVLPRLQEIGIITGNLHFLLF